MSWIVPALGGAVIILIVVLEYPKAIKAVKAMTSDAGQSQLNQRLEEIDERIDNLYE